MYVMYNLKTNTIDTYPLKKILIFYDCTQKKLFLPYLNKTSQ